MPVVTKLQSCAKPPSEPRPVLKPAGNRVIISQDPKRNNLKKPQRPIKPVPEIPNSVVRSNVSLDSTCSSDSSSSTNASAKKVNSASRTTVKRNGFKPVRVVPHALDVATLSPTPKPSGPPKRCDWITPHSDPLYIAFHDEEWGVPVFGDDIKLFELLVFSQALAEHSWPAILKQRDIFRKLFENFDPSSIAQFSEKKLLTLKINGNSVLSEPKLRAIVENAKQLLKVQQEFGSFSNYCWRFVNHRPIRNEFRYGRQVPVKTPKAELISKDMMRRGTKECNATTKNEFKIEVKEKKVQIQTEGRLTGGDVVPRQGVVGLAFLILECYNSLASYSVCMSPNLTRK